MSRVVTLRMKHWLEVDGRFAIGDGGVELLRAISAHGTLAKAACEVGWSYRHAWGYIRRAEEALGAQLTGARSGKGTARGLELTATARRLIRRFPSGAKSRRFPKLLRGPHTMTDWPIACTLTPDALAARRAGLLSDLLQRAEGREDLPEGLRLRFAPTVETLATIARAVGAERHCCRFLRFGITVEPDGGPVFLDLTGPTGTREFIGALLEV